MNMLKYDDLFKAVQDEDIIAVKVWRLFLVFLNLFKLQKIQKNPHTIQFFCDIENILNCDNNDCVNQSGYKYSLKLVITFSIISCKKLSVFSNCSLLKY